MRNTFSPVDIAGGEVIFAEKIPEKEMGYFAERVPTTRSIGAKASPRTPKASTSRRTRSVEVGGVLSSTPLRVVDLNHVGIFYDDEVEAVKFYANILGLSFTDVIPKIRAFFLRINSEHHTVSLFDRKRMTDRDDLLMQHSAWELGTFDDVTFAIRWLRENGVEPELICRRMPGSNYTVYFLDPEWNRIELEFRMETVGWEGRPKPFELWESTMIYGKFPAKVDCLERETEQLRKRHGFFTDEKFRWTMDEAKFGSPLARVYDASGEVGERPFKLGRLSYYTLKCADLSRMARFYSRILGLRILAKTPGSVALAAPGNAYPDLILESGTRKDETERRMGALCFEMRNYAELRESIGYLRERGVKLRHIGRSKILGTDDGYCVDFDDPSGDPIRLSFSPRIHGLREVSKRQGGSKLPGVLNCA